LEPRFKGFAKTDQLDRMELLFILLFRYLRQVRGKQLRKVAEIAQGQAKRVAPVVLK